MSDGIDELPLSEELLDELELADPLTDDVLLLLSEELLDDDDEQGYRALSRHPQEMFR